MNVQQSFSSYRYISRNGNIAQKFVGREGDKKTHLENAFTILKKFISAGLNNDNRDVVKEVLSMCFSISDLNSPKTLNPLDEEVASLINIAADLNKNTSRFFKVVFPRSVIDLAAMCYIMSKLKDAFTGDGSLNISGFKQFLGEMLDGTLGQEVFNSIEQKYLNNIKKEGNLIKCNNYEFEYSLLLQNQNDDNSSRLIKEVPVFEIDGEKYLIGDNHSSYIEKIYTKIEKGNYDAFDGFLKFLYTLTGDNLISELESILCEHVKGDKERFISFYIELTRCIVSNKLFHDEKSLEKLEALRDKLKPDFINHVQYLSIVINHESALNDEQLKHINDRFTLFDIMGGGNKQNMPLVNALKSDIIDILTESYLKHYTELYEKNRKLSILGLLEQDIEKLNVNSKESYTDNLIYFEQEALGEIKDLYHNVMTELNKVIFNIEQYDKTKDFQSLIKQIVGMENFVNKGFGLYKSKLFYVQFDEIKLLISGIISAHTEYCNGCIDCSPLTFWSDGATVNGKINAVASLLAMLESIRIGRKDKSNMLLVSDELDVMITDAEKTVGKGLSCIEKSSLSDKNKSVLNHIKKKWELYLNDESIWDLLLNSNSKTS